MATLTVSQVKISFAVPRPFLNQCYPLLEPHILQLFQVSEKGTVLPTTVDEVTAQNNMDADAKKQHEQHLDRTAVVYSTTQTHSVVYRSTLTKLFVDLGDGIEHFFHQFLNGVLARIHSFSPFSPLSTVMDPFINSLSTFILKAGFIVDTLTEVSKSIDYGHEHHGNIPKRLSKSVDFNKDDLKILGTAIPATIQTLLAVQGGLAFMLTDLIAMKNAGIMKMLAEFQVESLLPTGSILTSWTKVSQIAGQQQQQLHIILAQIRQTAASNPTA